MDTKMMMDTEMEEMDAIDEIKVKTEEEFLALSAQEQLEYIAKVKMHMVMLELQLQNKIKDTERKINERNQKMMENYRRVMEEDAKGNQYVAGMKIETEKEFDALCWAGKCAYIREIWAGVSSYDEYLKMNMEYIKGNIYATPYNGAPLCADSVELSDDLISLHKRRILTSGGQGMIFEADEKQIPYVELLMEKNDNTRALIEEIKSKDRFKWNIYLGQDGIITNVEKDECLFYVTYIMEGDEWEGVTHLGHADDMPNDIFDGFNGKMAGLNIEDYYQISISFKSFKETGLEKEILAMCDKCGIRETIE